MGRVLYGRYVRQFKVLKMLPVMNLRGSQVFHKTTLTYTQDLMHNLSLLILLGLLVYMLVDMRVDLKNVFAENIYRFCVTDDKTESDVTTEGVKTGHWPLCVFYNRLTQCVCVRVGYAGADVQGPMA